MDSAVTRCLSRWELDEIADGSAALPAAAAAHLSRCRACAEVVEAARFAKRFGAVLSSDGSVELAVTRGVDDAARFPEALGYRFLEEVASGGQGVVYRAEQTATGQMVAIKVLHAGRRGAGGSSGSMARARFVREIQIAASLQHPGIVRVLDSIILGDGRDAIIMEWIDGTPMDMWADDGREGERHDESRLLRLIAEVADAVAYAHLRGVIHRDLKPSNVVVDSAGRPHVLDFGVAWRREEAGGAAVLERLTVAGEFTGTLAFAAPEQVSGEGLMPDTRTDVYALGVIGYRVLTGGLPFDVDRSLESAILNIRHAELPSRPPARVSGDAWVVISKAMSKDTSRRYQSAAEFASDLRRVAEGVAISARADSRLYVFRKAAKRHRVAIGFGVTVLLGLVGLLVSLWAGNTRLAVALRESRLQELRAHTAVGARDRAEDILWAEIGRAMPGPVDVSRVLWEGPVVHRELLWSFVEMQAQAMCVDVAESPGGSVLSIERLHDGRLGLVTSDRRVVWLDVSNDKAEFMAGPSLSAETVLGRFSPSGRYLVSREPERMRCVDTATGEVIGQLDLSTIGFAVSSELIGEWGVLLCSQGDAFVLATLPGLEVLLRFQGGPIEQRPWIHPTQRRLMLIDEIGDVVVLDVDSGQRTCVAGGELMGWEQGPKFAQVLSTEYESTIAVAHIDGITVAGESGESGGGRVERISRIKPGSRVTASLSGDGRFLAAQAFGDSTLRLWNAHTGRELTGLAGHRGAVLVHAISHDGSRIVTVDHDGMVRVWRAPGYGWRVGYGSATSRTHQFAMSADGAAVWSCDARGRLVRHCFEGFGDAAPLVRTIRDAAGGLFESVRVASAGCSDGVGGIVASAGVGDRVALLTSARELGEDPGVDSTKYAETSWVSVGGGDVVTGLAFVPGGLNGVVRLLVSTQRGVWVAFDGQHGGEFVEAGRGGGGEMVAISEVCCSGDGSMAAVSLRDGRVVLIDPATLGVVRVVNASSSQLRSVAFSPDGRTLAAVGDSGELVLIDTRSGTVRRSGRAGEDTLFAVAFHPSGKTVAVGDRAGRVLMFDSASLSVVGTLRAGGAVMCLGFTPDGGSLVVSALESPIERWDFGVVASSFSEIRPGG